MYGTRELKFRLVNGLSASRLILSPLFVLLATDPNETVRLSSAFLLGLILVSDWADGWLARRWKVTSRTGYVLDGLGDRASYVAFLFAFARPVDLAPVVMFLLVFRDVALYAARSFSRNWEDLVERTRWLTKSYAALFKLGLLLGLAVLYEPAFRGVRGTGAWFRPEWVGWYLSAFCVYSYLTLGILVRSYVFGTPKNSTRVSEPR